MAASLNPARSVPLPPAVKAKPYQSKHPTLPRATPAPVKQGKAKAPPHEFPTYDAPLTYGYAASPKISPAELYKVLEVAPYVRIDFDNEKKLQNFRTNLYKVNVEGKFRYATRREGWSSLIVLRLK